MQKGSNGSWRITPTPKSRFDSSRTGAAAGICSWTGTWEDTLFFVGGEMTMEITQDGGQVDGAGSIDLSPIGLGDEPGTALRTRLHEMTDGNPFFVHEMTRLLAERELAGDGAH